MLSPGYDPSCSKENLLTYPSCSAQGIHHAQKTIFLHIHHAQPRVSAATDGLERGASDRIQPEGVPQRLQPGDGSDNRAIRVGHNEAAGRLEGAGELSLNRKF